MFAKTDHIVVTIGISIGVDMMRAWWIVIKPEYRVSVFIRDKLAKGVPRFDS